MNTFLKKWNEISLVKQIIIGLVIGVVLALTVPEYVSGITIFGDLFVGALKSVAPVLVLFLVMSAICQHKSGQKTNMKSILVLYLLGTFLAGSLAVIASFIFPIELDLVTAAGDVAPPEGITEVLKTLLFNVVANPINALLNANYIGILAWAILLGIALRHASENTKTFIGDVAEAVSNVVRWVIKLAPLGVMGLVFNSIATSGLEALLAYGKLIVLLVGVMAVDALVINPIIVYVNTKQNPYPLVFKCLKESGITAFFTRSSAANIPVNMRLCDELGLDKDTYSISIPLGATINMDGTAIYQGVCAIFIAQIFGVDLTLMQQITVVLTAVLASIGTAGVPGSGMIMLAMVLQSVGLPVEGIAIVAGIDRILNMARVIPNIVGDAAVAVVVAKSEGELHPELVKEEE